MLMDMKELYNYLCKNDPNIASLMQMGKAAKVQFINDDGYVEAEFEVDARDMANALMAKRLTMDDIEWGDSLVDLLSKAGCLPIPLPLRPDDYPRPGAKGK